MKFEIMVVYENSSNRFDMGHCQIKVKVTVRPFPHDAIQIERFYRSTLTQYYQCEKHAARMLILIRHACSTDNNIPNL